ncbi:MAG: nuclear transport factor 2 family protein [Acidobacteriota bacterium]
MTATPDPLAAANAIARFFAAVDDRRWSDAEAVMSDPFHLDYSSFGAGPGADRAPKDILQGWSQFLPGFEHTHHQLGNLDLAIDGDSARAQCYGTATHVIGDRVWTVVGVYHLTLRRAEQGWKLTGNRFAFKYQSGDTDLPAEAQKRMVGEG